jgi:ABC-2 type transport system permease protein
MQLTYKLQLFLRFSSVGFTILIFLFVSKLVGDADALASYQGGYFDFVLVGFAMTSFTLVGMQTFSRTISTEMTSGTLEVLLATPNRIGSVLAGALVTPLLISGIEIILYFAIGIGLLGTGLSVQGVLLAIPLIVLTLLTFSALGILSAAFIVVTKRGDPVTVLLSQATNFLAGSVFPISLLPPALQSLSILVPTYYGLEGTRAVLLAQAGFSDIVDELLVLTGFTAVLLPLSLWVMSRSLRFARIMGLLGTG